MKADSQFPTSASPYVALFLKLAGGALILGIVIDYLTLLVPPNFLNSEWVSNLVDQFVGRGVVPLLGMALLFLGMWIDESIHHPSGKKWVASTIALSLVLGLMFLLFTPLYFNSNRLVSASASQAINKQAETAAQQLDRQLSQRKSQVEALISSQEQVELLKADLKNDLLDPEERAMLQELQETLDRVKSDPKLLEQEVAKARNAGIEQIGKRQNEAKAQLQEEMRRSRLRITSVCFVLGVGYLAIGWMGVGTLRGAENAPGRKSWKSSKKSSEKGATSKRMRKGKA